MRLRGRMIKGLKLLVLWLVLVAAPGVILPDNVSADRTFSRRYATNSNGDIYLIGNAILTCNPAGPTGGATCVDARAGNATAGNANDNNAHTMMYIDADSDTSTFSSSSADLSMPAGSSVIWAGLYWGGQAAATTPRNQALFQTPSTFGYVPVIAQQFDTSSGTPTRFSSFADVTSLVQSGGNGTYFVANVQSSPGSTNVYAGWTLIVIFGNNSLPLRNLSVFDGMSLVPPSVTITVNGFLTPLSGPVVTTLGAVTYEGDRSLTGDYYNLNAVAMSDAAHPANNFFNSSISDFGVNVSSKNPNYVNQLGFDIARMDMTGRLANGATSATFSAGTNTDQFYPTVLTFSTDLYVPIITPNLVKTITDLNGGSIVPGDTLRFTVSMSNTGLDTATDLMLTDNIPANTTYVPGSLRIVSGANAGAKTDASGDDQAEYISTGTPRVAFRLGNGADATNGGTLPYTGATSLTFDVTVNGNTPAGTVISNAVQISYKGQTIGTTFAGASSAATATVTAAPLISKTFMQNPIAINGTSQMRIIVSNAASNPTTLNDVVFNDTYPANLQNTSSPNATVSCTGGSSATLTGGTAGGNTVGITNGTIAPGGSCTVNVNVTSSFMGNYLNETDNVTSSNGGSGGKGSATLSVGKPAVTLKSFTSSSIISGNNSVVSFTLTNPSSVPVGGLTGVQFSDPLTNMLIANPPSVVSNCGGTVSAPAGGNAISLTGGTLAALGTCTITLNVTSNVMGVHPNQTSGVSSDQTAPAGVASNIANLTVIGAPVATKSFSPSSIRQSTGAITSLLSITVSNPNTTTTITGLSFTDTYPPNLVNATVPNPAINCTSGSSATRTGGTAGGNTIGMNSGSLAPGGSCTVTVFVSSNVVANYNNSTGNITTANAGTGAAASATLNVTNLNAPTVAKSFTTAIINQGATSVLTVTLSNSNGTAITGAAFTDTYPIGMVNTSTPNGTTTCAGGTVTATAGGSSVSLGGATIPAGGSCTVNVNVTASAQGSYFNTIPIGGLTTSNGGTNMAAGSATLTVNAAPITTKYFSTNPILPGGATVLNISINNPNGFAINGVAFTDNYPAGLLNTGTPGLTNTCGGTATANANGSFVSLSGGTVAANGSCLITVNVTAASAGSYTNSTGNVTTSNAGTGAPATTTLTVMGPPVIAKVFGPATINSNAVSTMTITLTNNNSAAILGAAFTDSYPVNMFNAAAPTVVNTCGGTITANAGGNQLILSGGTVPSYGSCSVLVNVTAGPAGSYLNNTGAVTTTNAGTGSSASATLTVVAGISGYVYLDSNHSGGKDGAEAGTGQTLYVKLTTRTGTNCTSPAVSAAAADTVTGIYSFTGLGPGDYCLILDTNNTLADITAGFPSGWIGTDVTNGVRLVTLSGTGLLLQNFGLFNGSTITGRVFRDTGMSGGTANDGVLNGGETGISGVTVNLTNDAGNTIYDTKTTDADGYFSIHIPGTLTTGTFLKITETNPPAFLSTGAEAGSTGGTYSRASDTVRFSLTAGTNYNGINFGDVAENVFLTDGAQTALPGTVLYYPHTFVAGSAGSLTFSTVSTRTPDIPGWSEVLYIDTNCNAMFDPGEPQITAPIAAAAAQQICILLKEFIPANAGVNNQNQVTVTASFAYTNASPALNSSAARTDITMVGQPTSSGLNLVKTVDKAAVLPGDTLVYTITYTNQSAGPLSSIVINDSTPAYTIYVSAVCGAPLPSNITLCTITQQPSAGGTGTVQWTLTGTLISGASGSVSYTVQVQN